MAKANKKLTLSDLVVLSLVAEEPMHGYQIVTQLEYRDAKDWAPVSRPQVYYSINKLVEMGLIQPVATVAPSLGPEKVQYTLTAQGEAQFIDELSKKEWATQRQPPPFLTWMALSSHLSRRETLKVIKARQVFLNSELKREQETLKAVLADSGPMTTAARLMLTLTLELFAAELRWLGTVEKELGTARKSPPAQR